MDLGETDFQTAQEEEIAAALGSSILQGESTLDLTQFSNPFTLEEMSGVGGTTNTSGNTGCGVVAPSANSYGPSFNAAGGGFYAMERTNSFIKVWFWSRNANVPSDVRNGGSTVNTDAWVCYLSLSHGIHSSKTNRQGTPTAFFPNTNCDLASHFGPNEIVINLTFCMFFFLSFRMSRFGRSSCGAIRW